MPLISIIAPVYKCADSIDELYARLTKTLPQISHDYEIIFVNDGSPDDAWEIISLLAKNDKKVKGINFSRNFGQHNAITAGLELAKGDWLIIMDCDLQDQPEEIIKMHNKCMEGYDYVAAIRKDRKDNFVKVWFSKTFYFILGYLTGVRQENRVGNFGIYHRKVIAAVLSMKDYVRYFPSMVKWVGFNYTCVEVEHSQRKTGKTSYSFYKLLKLALNVILSFSDKPLKLTVKFGFFLSLLSFIYALYIIVRVVLFGSVVLGWSSLIVTLTFFFGIIIFLIGLLGLYVGKIFEKVKDRPRYIISEKLNYD